MSRVAPLGDVYQAGTLSGNPLAVTAGLTTLQLLTQPGLYGTLEDAASYLFTELGKLAKKHGVPAQVNRVGSMGTVFFTAQPVVDFASALTSDTKRFARLFCAMLDRGVYLAPSQFEAAFTSVAHDTRAIDRTLTAAREAFKTL